MDFGDVSAFADEEAKDKEWERAKNSEDDEAEGLINRVEVENGVSGEGEERKSEEDFRERNEKTERESFGKVVGSFGASVNVVSEVTGEPKLGGAFALVVEEPGDEAESDEKAKEDDVANVWQAAGES